MRIIMSGGGTGGHIYPAITIIKAIEQLVQPCEILFVGTKYGLEADIIPKEGFAFATLEVRGFERRLSWKNVQTIFKTMGSMGHAKKIISRFKPDLVIGTGGYVCGPILLAASLMGVPTMIQEQNVIPGITNKILARFVDKIAVGYLDAARYFRQQSKVVFTGNPIRAEVLQATREQGLMALGLSGDKRTILISGGSRGARSINQAMLKVYPYFAGRKDIQFLHVTGQNEYNIMVEKMGLRDKQEQQGCVGVSDGNVMIKPYLYNMPEALAVADLAIFRAGAIGLAELTARGLPAILIPYPYAAENHQEYNARVMEKQGAAVVIRDKELDDHRLIGTIEELMNHSGQLSVMTSASKKLGCPEATENIAKLALALVKR